MCMQNLVEELKRKLEQSQAENAVLRARIAELERRDADRGKTPGVVRPAIPADPGTAYNSEGTA